MNSLMPREKQGAELLLQGQSNKQIALTLAVSVRTVEFHLMNIDSELLWLIAIGYMLLLFFGSLIVGKRPDIDKLITA